jgi:hypothetical protein
MMDLERIAARAACAYDWIVRSQTAKGQGDWMPLSAREVFKTDIPWMLAQIDALILLVDERDLEIERLRR